VRAERLSALSDSSRTRIAVFQPSIRMSPSRNRRTEVTHDRARSEAAGRALVSGTTRVAHTRAPVPPTLPPERRGTRTSVCQGYESIVRRAWPNPPARASADVVPVVHLRIVEGLHGTPRRNAVWIRTTKLSIWARVGVMASPPSVRAVLDGVESKRCAAPRRTQGQRCLLTRCAQRSRDAGCRRVSPKTSKGWGIFRGVQTSVPGSRR
jgi:hypothetical protein